MHSSFKNWSLTKNRMFLLIFRIIKAECLLKYDILSALQPIEQDSSSLNSINDKMFSNALRNQKRIYECAIYKKNLFDDHIISCTSKTKKNDLLHLANSRDFCFSSVRFDTSFLFFSFYISLMNRWKKIIEYCTMTDKISYLHQPEAIKICNKICLLSVF